MATTTITTATTVGIWMATETTIAEITNGDKQIKIYGDFLQSLFLLLFFLDFFLVSSWKRLQKSLFELIFCLSTNQSAYCRIVRAS